MLILVNALSIGNMSGRYVLLGNTLQMLRLPEVQLLVVHNSSHRDWLDQYPADRVRFFEAPPQTAKLLARSLWEPLNLPRIAKRFAVDIAFTPTGTITPNMPCPQWSLAQNPWAFVRSARYGRLDEFKALLQRRAYANAYANAEVMLYVSSYIHSEYAKLHEARERSAGRALAKADQIVPSFTAIDQEIRDKAKTIKVDREPLQLLTVSQWLPHKNLELNIDALAILRNQYGVNATLKLVGRWFSEDYERAITKRIADAGLTNAVDRVGHISFDELLRSYAQARVFCLFSRCESFGIPALEAQVFGTPIIAADCCAVPEVCGAGGDYVGEDDAQAAAKAMHRLLTDDDYWQQKSDAALANSQQFDWEHTAAPLRCRLQQAIDQKGNPSTN